MRAYYKSNNKSKLQRPPSSEQPKKKIHANLLTISVFNSTNLREKPTTQEAIRIQVLCFYELKKQNTIQTIKERVRGPKKKFIKII